MNRLFILSLFLIMVLPSNARTPRPVIKNQNGNLSKFLKIESEGSIATGKYVTSIGENSIANSDYSFSVGNNSKSNSSYAYSYGSKTLALGTFSTAIGDFTAAMAPFSYSAGKYSTSYGEHSFSFGKAVNAKGKYSLAFGNKNYSGDFSISVGESIVNSGAYASAFGKKINNTGDNSYVFGESSNITANNSFSLGAKNDIHSSNSMALGNNLGAAADNSIVIGSGLGSNKLTNNNPNSLMIGFQSQAPTLFVTGSDGFSDTGSVGIGTTDIDIAAKLNVKGKIKIDDGSQAEGKLLISDDKGVARWVSPDEIGLVVRKKKHKDTNQEESIEEDDMNSEDDAESGKDMERPESYMGQKRKPGFQTNSLVSGNFGTNNPVQKMHISGAMKLEPQQLAPENPTAGDIYYNKSGVFCGYIEDQYGGYWASIVGSGSCEG